MIGYEQVMKQVGELLGEKMAKMLPSPEMKGLPEVLNASETICGIASGLYSGRNGIIVATNERVFFFEKGRVWGSKLEEFRYENITSVQYSTGFIGGDITIFVAGNAAKIDMVPNVYCKPFVDAVQKIIGSRSTPPLTSNDEDFLAKLERLAALKSAGMLTDEEFKAAKLKLLT